MSKIILLVMSVAISAGGIVAHADGYYRGEDQYNYDTPRIPDDNYGREERRDRRDRRDRDVDPRYYEDYDNYEEDYSRRRRHDHDHDHYDRDCNRCRPVCDAWTCGAPPVLAFPQGGICAIVANGYGFNGWTILRDGSVLTYLPYDPRGLGYVRNFFLQTGQCLAFAN